MAQIQVAPGIEVLVRGWVHGNCVLLRGGEPGLIDTGYHTGIAALAEAWTRTPGPPLSALQRVLLTHVHSDHAGGVAWLQRRTATTVLAHPDAIAAVAPWDTQALWLTSATGQELPQFSVDQALSPCAAVTAGGLTWQVLATPGHARGGVAFYNPRHGVLVTGDALWERGFGLLNPWHDGPGVYDGAARALDTLAQVDARVVVPGHGEPFTDLQGAIRQARGVLAHMRARPDRLRAQVIRNTLSFWVRAHRPPTLAAARTQALVLARALGPLPGDLHPARPEALAAAALDRLADVLPPA